MLPFGPRKAPPSPARSRPAARSLTLMRSSPADGSSDDPTACDSSSPTGPSDFDDVEGERLFEQVRSRLFARPRALKVGRHRILRRLGAGAMGEVQLAIDDDLDRLIAIKFVHVHLASRSG